MEIKGTTITHVILEEEEEEEVVVEEEPTVLSHLLAVLHHCPTVWPTPSLILMRNE